MSDVVNCKGGTIFNVASQRCVSTISDLGILIGRIANKMSQGGDGMPYFTRGCKEGSIKNPVTNYCVNEDSELGRTISQNVEERRNGNILHCREPNVFNSNSGQCVMPYNNVVNMQSCASFSSRGGEYTFMPHEEQTAIADWFINQSNNRGIVLFHSLGSGKTCTSIIMIDMWLDKHPDRYVFIYLPASLRQNFINEYCTRCGKDREHIEERFIFVSYNYVSNQRASMPTHDILEGNLVVIDEFHRIILGMVNEGVHYPAVFNSINAANPDKIICLTGTGLTQTPLEVYYSVELCTYENPFGSNVDYIQNELNIQGNTFFPTNPARFKAIASTVYSRLKPVITSEGAEGYPVVYSHIKYVPMVEEQYLKYMSRKDVETNMRRHRPQPDEADYENKRRRYYLGVSMLLSRQVCNMIYSTVLGAPLSSYSPKFDLIVNDVATHPGKHVIYSQFKTLYGVFFLENILESRGFKCLDFTGDNNDPQRANILATFNASNNANGEKIKCLLITSAGSMGLNLFAVRTLHIVEQSINPMDKAQAKGRAVRFGGHLMLPPEDRNVRIIEYLATKPGRNIPDDTEVNTLPISDWTSDIEAYLVAQRKTNSVAPLLEILDSLPLIPTEQA